MTPRAGRRTWRLMLLAGGVALATSIAAVEGPGSVAAYDPSYLTSLEWRSVGPLRGGRALAVTGSARRPSEYFFGASGGVWKTSDGGISWQPVSDDALSNSSVGALAVSPSNPDIVYAGTGDPVAETGATPGDGVYRSADGGRTWSRAGFAGSQIVSRLRVDPRRAETVFAAVLGDPYRHGPTRGVYRSADGGATWSRVLYRDDLTGAVDLAIDPNAPAVLYAALWQVSRTPYSLSSRGKGSGLFKSSDGGTTWTELTGNPGMPAGPIGRIGVTVSSDPRRVFALVEADQGGLFRSDDAGSSWQRVNDDPRLRQRPFEHSTIYSDPRSRDVVYVLAGSLHRSIDGGRTFAVLGAGHDNPHDLWIAPNDPRRLVAATDAGAAISVNGGDTWTEDSTPTAQLSGVVTTNDLPYHVCGAQQDDTIVCVPSDGRGADFYTLGGGGSGSVATHPRSARVYFAGRSGGLLSRVDRSTGQAWDVSIAVPDSARSSSGDLAERFRSAFPLVFPPRGQSTLYAGSQHLWRSSNEGQSWERISEDLTTADRRILTVGSATEHGIVGMGARAAISAIAPSRHDWNMIWVGSDDGVVSLTRDAGQTWRPVTPVDLPPLAWISSIEASPHKTGTAYLTASREGSGDRAPYVYRTSDYGDTWTKVVDGLPDDAVARIVREDIQRPGLLFLGTERGVDVSFDDGASWQSLRRNLAATPIHGMVVEGNDVVIATHGRGFYILDSIGVLRQLGPGVTTASVHLFAPRDVIRRLQPGVVLDYYLKEPAERLQLEVIDAQGQTVRRFTATSGDSSLAASHDETGEGARRASEELSGRPGTQRFVWDLRYPGIKRYAGVLPQDVDLRGPLAPPGEYQVRLTAGGQVRTQTFTVRVDPRLVEVTPADLAEMFTLAQRVRDRANEAGETVARIRQVRSELGMRVKEASSVRDLAVLVDGLDRAMTEVEARFCQPTTRGRPDAPAPPHGLAYRIATLLRVIDGADGRPADQIHAEFQELAGEIEKQIGGLDALFASRLPPINDLLRRRGLDPVSDGEPTRVRRSH